jgi:hypothetical protein
VNITPAVLDTRSVGAVLRLADKAEVGKGVRRAHYLAEFTAQRIGEFVPATWEIDLDEGVWAIPRERMKRRDEQRGPHEAPIPPRLLCTMKEWHRIKGRPDLAPEPQMFADLEKFSQVRERGYASPELRFLGLRRASVS